MAARNVVSTGLPGADLVASAAGGDPGAIRELVAAVTPGAVRYCRARLRHGADEVAHEACLAILHALPGWAGPFPALVYELTAQTVAGARAPEADSPVLALPGVEREIMLLRVAAGLSAEETASALRLSANQVRLVQHRALNRLRGISSG
ncbi:sigma factor-like helix-turn-helix DNA-binding protein [Amycolatopsis thermalba]|uniref:sigma factor-like helix-turn-helix DNA-binding protein n=1 Tax=Amycolatopsis thermalba TaxID=944492 RepID=UPI000E223297|nr:sigma factor-like helix-turn-helix DNA-binding protein [Amycolatopsis thermalba]